MLAILWLCLQISVTLGERYWYLGCHEVANRTDGGADWEDGGAEDGGAEDGGWRFDSNVTVITTDIALCAQHCLTRRFEYCGIQYGRHCRCWADDHSGYAVTEELCKERCYNESSLPLACGGEADVWSVYRTAGPYLTAAELQVDADWVVIHKPVALETIVH
ncbi:hypothetical protein ScPMuIL_015601 [Solemya velum]